MFDFDDFFPEWDDIALAAAMGEEFSDDECERLKCFIDETSFEKDDDLYDPM
jgi:hypothetical protein